MTLWLILTDDIWRCYRADVSLRYVVFVFRRMPVVQESQWTAHLAMFAPVFSYFHIHVRFRHDQ